MGFSYSKILNELSSECPPIKIEESTNQDGQETTEAASNLSTNSIQYQPATGEFIQTFETNLL